RIVGPDDDPRERASRAGRARRGSAISRALHDALDSRRKRAADLDGGNREGQKPEFREPGFLSVTFSVSDPLPPSAALLLCKGETGFTVPLTKGDSAKRRGSLTTLFALLLL